MGKRLRAEEPSEDTSKPPKRPRASASQNHAAPEEITSARQLQNLLVFEQDQTRLLNSITSAKAFLASILHPDNEDDVPRRRGILRDYLDTQKPRNDDAETEYMPSLMQSWQYATTANSDSLSSVVASTIDQLLKLLSSNIDFRDEGLLLCKTLLQQAQLRLLSRGVASPKHKEHIIGPCLRILKEIVTFDGGTLARQVYAKRDLAFDPQSIARCLTYRRHEADQVEDIIKKPTLRTTAIRYILAHFKFQDDGAKADMLKQGNMLRILLDGIEGDHPRIVSDVLTTFLRDVIQDTGIPRRNKTYLFNERNLLALCQLYRSPLARSNIDDEGTRPLMDVVHEFMVTATTSPDAGLMRASGWYPPTTDAEGPLVHSAADETIDLGLDGIAWYQKFIKHIPVRNQILADFVITLRPYAYDYERRLLIKIFEASPELVAWFMKKMSTFSFAPKLTATWIGYAATLFEVVQLPVPSLYARMSHLPPPVTIMIESILPGPLDQKTLRSCLVSKSDLVRLFSVRILVASLEKLRNVLTLLKEKSLEHGKLWQEAAVKLVEEFGRRCPTLQDVVKLYNTLRNAEGEKKMQRDVTLRLLALYHEVLPELALEENFDVSAPLNEALEAIEKTADQEQGDKTQLALLELSHLVRIASWSSSVHWFVKPKGSTLKYSAFVSLLQLLARSTSGSSTDLERLVEGILKDGDFVQPRALRQLITSLGLIHADQPGEMGAVFTFLDRCFVKLSTRPIKYEDDKEAFLVEHGVGRDGVSQPASLLLMVILEQWPFPIEKKEKVGKWINVFFSLVTATGDRLAEVIQSSDVLDTNGLKDYNELKHTQIGTSPLVLALADAAGGKQDGNIHDAQPSNTNPTKANALINDVDASEALVLDVNAFASPPEAQDHPILTRYRKKGLPTLIDDGSLSALISILSSPHLSLRIQALTALRATMANLLESNHLERDTLYLLFGELIETCSDQNVSEKPLLGLAVSFGARAVDVLRDPTHALYIKTNEFLNWGPFWKTKIMASWWLERVLLHPPGDTDTEGAYWREVVWVLEWLVAGLRTNDDFDNLRRNGVYEKCMALFFHPSLDNRRFADLVVDESALERETGLQAKVRPLITRLVVRGALAGGATIMVTGMGVFAWLSDVGNVIAGDERAKGIVEGVTRMVLERADGEKVKEWSSGALSKV